MIDGRMTSQNNFPKEVICTKCKKTTNIDIDSIYVGLFTKDNLGIRYCNWRCKVCMLENTIAVSKDIYQKVHDYQTYKKPY
jgi:hypothetical protein